MRVGDLVRLRPGGRIQSRGIGLVVADDTPTVGFCSIKILWFGQHRPLTYGSTGIANLEVVNARR